MKTEKQNTLIRKDSAEEERILQSYDCKMACRVCPYPGAKCNRLNQGNVKDSFE